MKVCSKCKVEKSKSDFHKNKNKKDGLQVICKCCCAKKSALCYKNNPEKQSKRVREWQIKNHEKCAENARKYREANPEKVAASARKWQHDNHEKCAERLSKWQKENPEKVAEYHKRWEEKNPDHKNQYRRNRKEANPLYALSCRIRRLIGISLQRQGYSKKSRASEILGCSYDEFKLHIENQFTDGMNWDRMSEIHIDHKIPIASATTEEELLKLNHYSNLQPLWALDNRKKGDRIPVLFSNYETISA